MLFPDHPAQTLFDLLNRRDLPHPNLSEQTKRCYVPARGASSRDRDEALSKLPDLYPFSMQFAVKQPFVPLQKAAGKGVALEQGEQGEQGDPCADFG